MVDIDSPKFTFSKGYSNSQLYLKGILCITCIL